MKTPKDFAQDFAWQHYTQEDSGYLFSVAVEAYLAGYQKGVVDGAGFEPGPVDGSGHSDGTDELEE